MVQGLNIAWTTSRTTCTKGVPSLCSDMPCLSWFFWRAVTAMVCQSWCGIPSFAGLAEQLPWHHTALGVVFPNYVGLPGSDLTICHHGAHRPGGGGGMAFLWTAMGMWTLPDCQRYFWKILVRELGRVMSPLGSNTAHTAHHHKCKPLNIVCISDLLC